jgi:rhodanese-related sulfurtransferase
MSTIPELGPREFIERWPGFPGDGVTLLDVREPYELAISAIAGSVDIPMGQIPARLNELDRRAVVVVLCRSGARSLGVAEFLAASGFESVFNLRGGINAWSTEVDPTIPRY